MNSENKRAHGVTPGLQNDYLLRTADKQAAFFIPYLKSGMSVIDLGCGPGTITTGFAKIVSPGLVTGRINRLLVYVLNLLPRIYGI